MKVIIIFILLAHFIYANENYYYQNSEKVAITPSFTISRSDSKIDYYENNIGQVLGVTDKLILKVKNSYNLENYLEEFNITIEKILGKNLYLLKVENKNLTIDISNALYEKSDVKYAHPDFIKDRVSR